MMKIPSNSVSLVRQMFGKIFPVVRNELTYWKKRACEIPNEELRKQALQSIETKEFHCEGGSVYALFGSDEWKHCVKFIVAYQTISDYLDNLCDRSTSLDKKDFEHLHLAMTDSLQINSPKRNYYQYREDQNDGGYLTELVLTCQSIIKKSLHYSHIQDYVQNLASHYSHLQVYKHVHINERETLLKTWFTDHENEHNDLEWYEFAACTGSTIGIFCLVSSSFTENFSETQAKEVHNLYFPYFQGLHILLDYFIDQEEDLLEGDLNFVSYYENQDHIYNRLSYFSERIKDRIVHTKINHLHYWIFSGLFGVYLSDPKIKESSFAKRLLKNGGSYAKFFYYNRKSYELIKGILRKKRSLA